MTIPIDDVLCGENAHLFHSRVKQQCLSLFSFVLLFVRYSVGHCLLPAVSVRRRLDVSAMWKNYLWGSICHSVLSFRHSVCCWSVIPPGFSHGHQLV